MNRGLTGKAESYRNPNGIYMKLNNFKSIDPEYTRSGKVGLWRTSKKDEAVWADYSQNTGELRRVSDAIYLNIEDNSIEMPAQLDNDNWVSAKEGKVLTRVHKIKERNRKIVSHKKNQAFLANGKLSCEACGFDFSEAYGIRGEGVIEAHHNKPLHTLNPQTKTTLNDLTLLCANCHRIVHAKSPWLTLEELKATIQGDFQK